MKQDMFFLSSIIISLFSGFAYAEDVPSGVKGQNYDRIVVENPSDGEARLVARIRVVSTVPDSSSTIVVTDNGESAFGPQTEEVDAWKREISIKGKGRHEVVLTCRNVKSSAVYCMLDADDRSLKIVN